MYVTFGAGRACLRVRTFSCSIVVEIEEKSRGTSVSKLEICFGARIMRLMNRYCVSQGFGATSPSLKHWITFQSSRTRVQDLY